LAIFADQSPALPTRSGRIRYEARGPVEWDRADIIWMLKQMTAEQPPGGE